MIPNHAVKLVEGPDDAAPRDLGYQHVTVEDREIETAKGYRRIAFAVIHSADLCKALRLHIRTTNLFRTPAEVPLSLLVSKVFQLRELGDRLAEVQGFSQLIGLLEAAAAEEIDQVRGMTAEGKVDYSHLHLLFKAEQEVAIGEGSELRGGRVVGHEYASDIWGGERFEVTITYLMSDGRRLVYENMTAKIPYFNGVVDTSELPIRVLAKAEKASLQSRGEKYVKIAIGPTYAQYSGTLVRKSWWSSNQYKANGRVMIDRTSMARMEPDYFRAYRGNNDCDDDKSVATQESYWMCDKTLYGFSFAAKMWGEMDLDMLLPVVFDEAAFDMLVLAPDLKEQILALVEGAGSSFSDVITGKGGGCIFCLHGEPGTGKTLTAEAVAEVLKRPLYSISIGELGTVPDELEKRLRTILDMASTWNAVVLLDEADIFLEKRDENNIVRNAMVGIFLRLLEYHQGVLFLTTNRVRNFDPAFVSRISIALHYGRMTSETREKVWANLLHAAGIKGIDPGEMSAHDINGRQIKNSIRLAQSLARKKGEAVGIPHLNSVISTAAKFASDLERHQVI